MTNPIKYHIDDQRVAVLRVNRPEARNALNWAAQEAFAEAIRKAARDELLRGLVIAGAGDRAFVSGGDLKELVNHPEAAAGERLNRIMSDALADLMALPVPVIAAINGDAMGGGCEVLTACDLRLAAPHARFAFRQVPNGLTTGWGGTGRLVELLGQSRAMELLLTARQLDAAEAHRLGLVHRVIGQDETAEQAALDWAHELARLPRRALAATKALVHAATHLPLEDTSRLESQVFINLWTSEDHLEAMAAFNEKRPPQFNG